MKGPGSVDSPENPVKAEEKAINAELWHACAGPLVTLPLSGSLVVYFPQGHSEQVATCMQKDIDAQVPSYPNLPSKLICLLHSVTLHADTETDEVCAQMTLQPVNINDKEGLLASDVTVNPNKPQTEFFCKTLTASDTSTHGGFSVPRRAAEKIFPPLDYTMQPPAQELQARDLHDNLWTFRHIYRGQPKRHLLTTGWSLFVSAKRLSAGDSVLFVRDDKQRLLVGIRRANRQPTNIPSSVLSSDSMHIGVLAAAANAAANRSPFTVFYNPRASPSQFVIPLAKYQKAVYGNQISVGVRFRMMFETEESGTRRYMGTITGITDLDPVRWKNSKWRNLQVGWDESAAMGEKRSKVSIWEIEPVAVPFFIFPPMFGAKRPRQPWMPDDQTLEMENLFKRTMPWLSEEICIKDPLTQNTVMPGLSLSQWLTMQQNPSLANCTMWPDYLCSLTGVTAQNFGVTNLPGQLALQAQLQHNNMQFNSHGLRQRGLIDPPSQVSLPLNPLHPIMQDVSTQQGLQLVNQTSLFSQKQSDTMVTQPQVILHTQAPEQQQQQQPSLQCIQAMQTGLQSNQLQQQHLQQLLQQQQPQSQQQNRMSIQPPNQGNEQSRWPEYHIQMQLLQRLQQQTLQSTLQRPQMPQLHEHQRGLQKKPQVLLDSNSLSQQQEAPQQHLKVPPPDAQSIQSSQHHSEQMLQQQQVLLPELPGIILPLSTNFLSTTNNSLLAAGGVSVLTSDIPACLTSPSRNKCANISQQIVNRSHQQNTVTVDKTPLTAVTVTNPYSLCELTASPKVTKEMSKSENNEKPLLLTSQLNKHGAVSPQAYPSNTVQVDYLDTTSSATSACFSQTDGPFQQSFHASPGSELQDNDLNDAAFSVNVDGKLGIPLSTSQLLANDIGSGKFQDRMSGNVVACYNTPKEAQEELSSSMISQPFGVPDMAFNSIDSTFNESEFLNRNSWAPPQYQRMRTYTKVYKRGAVGRSIDITRYSCYDGLKQDLARMFNIEGQLENRQRRGWKLVYVDHENDLLLVGDDPWEEFVRCVRCIRILSPQEVKQISLDGDLRNGIRPNQACSSSDGGNTWEGTV